MNQTTISDLAAVLAPYGIDLNTFDAKSYGTSPAPIFIRFTNAAGAVIGIDDVYLDESGSVIQYGPIDLG